MLSVRVVTDIDELAKMSDAWSALQDRSATNSPTVSPTWLLPWWKTFGKEGGRTLAAVLFTDGERLVGLAPLLLRPQRSRAGIRFRTLELLASGEDENDEIGSDYLGVIIERGHEDSVALAFAKALATREVGPWDELSLRAMDGDAPFAVLLVEALLTHGISARAEVVAMSHHIRLPTSWDAYMDELPSSRRYLVRRSLRDFDRWADGTMCLSRATTPDEVKRGFGVLKALHTERWSDRGMSGAFVSERFCAFHETVMPELLASRALELLWITVRGEPVVATYNLIWGKKVHFYQSGRAVRLPSNIRPGIVMHAHAIQAAIAAGLEEYDFLQGQARYKAELGTSARPIVNLTAARPSLTDAARRATELAIEQLGALRSYRARARVREREHETHASAGSASTLAKRESV